MKKIILLFMLCVIDADIIAQSSEATQKAVAKENPLLVVVVLVISLYIIFLGRREYKHFKENY